MLLAAHGIVDGISNDPNVSQHDTVRQLGTGSCLGAVALCAPLSSLCSRMRLLNL